jgi:hypothetical protein
MMGFGIEKRRLLVAFFHEVDTKICLPAVFASNNRPTELTLFWLIVNRL